MRHALIISLAFFCGLTASAAEYTARYLYAETNEADKGALRIAIDAESPLPRIVIAFPQRSRTPYLGTIHEAKRQVHFEHLPIDKYDLLLVSDSMFIEGMELVTLPDDDPPEAELQAIRDEIAKIEGFFDRKKIHRISIQGTRAGVLLQQWRERKAVKQSGARIPGSIHSIDLIFFEKPLKGWQLVKRRQLYREELPEATPLNHVHNPDIGGVRVIRSAKSIGPITIPESTEKE